jgi:Zn-dependent protease
MLGLAMSDRIVDGLFWFLAFLFSTTVHEAAHAYAALRGGDRTAYEGGQVSMSPIPHIKREPIGMLVVPLVTALWQGWALGWASAPFDPRWAERYPRRAAWMSAAGPMGNFALAVLAFVGLRIGLHVGAFVPVDHHSFSHVVWPANDNPTGLTAFLGHGLSVMLMLNVILGTFNLLPLPPLDGSSAIAIVLPASWADRLRYAMRTPAFSLVGLLIAWQVFPMIARPLGDAVVWALYAGIA